MATRRVVQQQGGAACHLHDKPEPGGHRGLAAREAREVADRPPLPRRRRGRVGGVHGDWAGDTNTGMNVIVAGTPRVRSTNYEGDTQSQRRTTPEEGTPKAASPRGKQEPVIVNGARSYPRCLLGPGRGAGGKHWGHDRQAPDCVLYGSSAQGGAARKLLKEAAAETRPNQKTKGILENFTRQRDLGQTTTSARPKSTADARVHAKTSGTRKTGAVRPRKPQHTTPKSRATPTKQRPKTAKRKAPSPSSSSSSSSSTTPADTTKTKGARENGMPAGHPLQRLARCTGHKESDDAFWAIMDWQSEDERKEKKAVQKTKKPKGHPPGQGTRHKEASHAAPFRARRSRRCKYQFVFDARTSGSVRPWKPTATGNPTRPVGDQVWHPRDLAACQEPHGRQNLRHHRAQRGAPTTKLGDSHNRLDDEDRHQDGQAGTKNRDKASTS